MECDLINLGDASGSDTDEHILRNMELVDAVGSNEVSLRLFDVNSGREP